MNHFEYAHSIDDLGVTVIENSFINHYMPKARGDYVKVYLYGLKSCAYQNFSPSNRDIAAALRLTEGDVISAWKYWDSEGVVRFLQNDDDCTIEFEAIAAKLFINGNDTASKKTKRKRSSTNVKIKHMNKDIEEKVARPLTKNELEMFQSWVDEYGFTPQTIVLLISDCIDRDKRSVNYWKSMALVFHDAGIKTYDQAQQFLKSRNARWGNYQEILNYLGFYRLATKPEKTYIDRWFDEDHFTLDDIKKACDETVKTNRPNIKYVDSVLRSDRTGQDASKVKRKNDTKKIKMQYDHNYDADEIEEALFGKEDND